MPMLRVHSSVSFFTLLLIVFPNFLCGQLSVSIKAESNFICPGETTIINSSVSGNSGSISYQWSTPQAFTGIKNNPSIVANAGGSYILTVSDQKTIAISEDESIFEANFAVEVNPPGGSYCIKTEGIELAATTAALPKSYLWKVPPGFTGEIKSQTILANVPGNYSVVVEQGDCFVESKTVQVNEVDLKLDLGKENPSSPGSADGKIFVSVEDGDPTYTWSYSKPGNAAMFGQSVANNFTIENLNSGLYQVNVNDGNSCEVSSTVLLSEPACELEVTWAVKSPSCEGGVDGSISLQMQNGKPGYDIGWEGPVSNNASTLSNSFVISDIPAGLYFVVVKDDAGCVVELEIRVNDPPGFNVNIIGDLVFCAGAGGTVLSTAPDGFKLYLWSNGTSGETTVVTSSGTYAVTVSDVAGCTASSSVSVTELEPLKISLIPSQSELEESCAGACDGRLSVNVTGGSEKNRNFSWTGPGGYSSSSQNITALCPGKYTLTVIDSEGCSATFTRTINTGSSLVLNLNGKNPTCSGDSDGNITLNFSGGSSPYQAQWSGTSSGSANNISDEYMITDLGPGSYAVTISDGKGCSQNSSITLSSAQEISFDAEELSPSCSGSNTGSIFIHNIKNGAEPYTVVWTHGGTSESHTIAGNSYTIELLVAGSYSVQIQDINGCLSAKQTVVVDEESEINVEIVGDITLCPDQFSGVLSTNPSGFSDYKWSTGSSEASITFSTTGDYGVTVTDGGGCTGRADVQVTRATEINLATVTGNSNLVVSCENDCDGKITPKVDGGMPPYEFQWTGPGGFSSESFVIDNLCSGVYILNVVDGNGCVSSYTQAISGTSTLEVKLDPTPVSCPGEKDGKVESLVEGGTSPYSYAWSNGIASPDLVEVPSGTYTLTVTDANGCSNSASTIVGELDGVDGDVNPTFDIICEGESTVLSASGGNSYLWNTGSTSSTISVAPLTTTSYSVTITGSNGSCSAVKEATVQVSTFPDANIRFLDNSGLANNDGDICSGSSITLVAEGGTSYLWEGGLPNPLIVSPAADRSYSVTISDGVGCSKVLTETINVFENPIANIDLENFTGIVGISEEFLNASEGVCGELASCLWEVNGEVVNNACENLEFTFVEPQEAEISLEVTNDCGCSDRYSETVPVTGENDCRLFFNTSSDGEACVGTILNLDVEFVPQSGCSFANSRIQVFKAGTEVFTYDEVSDGIIFNEAGTYSVRATYEDDCGCSTETQRPVVVGDIPSVSFAEDNVMVACENSLIDIFLTDFDIGESVTVVRQGVESTYESSSFQIFTGDPGSYVLQINKVSAGACSQEILNEILEIQVIENLKVVGSSFACNDANGTYSLTLETTGGDPSAPFQLSYPDAFVIGESITLNNLNPQVQYEFSIQRGANCEPISFFQGQVACNCTNNVGTIDDDVYFTGCTGTFFNISDLKVLNDDIDEFFDTLVYVLHDGEKVGELGEVYDVIPDDQIFITNDFQNYIPNKLYQLSLVSFRRFYFEELMEEGLEALNFLSIEDCVAVSNTVPVIWHGSEVSISGPSQVCENAYNEIFVSSGISDGAEILIDVPGLTSDNYSFVPEDGRLYVHFVSGTAIEVPISISTRTFHLDILKGDTISTTCESEFSYLVEIDEAHAAPDTSKVILWPGAIFASTDTTENICHRWGKTNRVSTSETRDTIFEGATDRFFFADPEDVASLNDNRQIWVETFFCDDPVCFTRNIYNGQFPINIGTGVAEGDVSIFPNPTEGDFTLTMNNSYKGKVTLMVYDIHGRHITRDVFEKNGNVMNKSVDLSGMPNGVYLVSVQTLGGDNFIYKVVKQQG